MGNLIYRVSLDQIICLIYAKKNDFQMSRNSPEPGCETCSQLSQLEVEAFTAVREVSDFVKSICISEILSRTPDLIFLNVITLEGNSLKQK